MKYITLIFAFLAFTAFGQETDSTLIAENAEPAVDESAALIEQGKDLFKQYCKACHAVDQRLVGPALKGVTERREMDWIINFVQNSNAMIESGDEYAAKLFQEYNQVQMPNQPVSADEIRAVMAYIQDAGNPNPSDNPIQRPIVEKANIKPLSFTDYRFWIIYTITVGLLIIGVYYKAEMEALRKKLDEPSGEEEA